MQSILAKYRPRTLADVMGQEAVVRSLKNFVKAPYETAILFHGESGTGKTSSAIALAHDLGVAVDEEELGGFHEIASGEQTADTVRRKMDGLRLGTLFGSHWKVLVVNECDFLSPQASAVWLDALEHLPQRAIVIFTTNQPERLSKRLRDRCESYFFQSDPETLAPSLALFARNIWRAEGQRGDPPNLDRIGMPTMGEVESMHASFRLAAQQLTCLLREVKAGGNVKAASAQLQKDLLVTRKAFEATCDHCGAVQDVRKGADKFRCTKCKKYSTADWSLDEEDAVA